MRKVEIDYKLWGAALGVNMLNVAICARWLTFGLWWTDVAVILFAAGAFILYGMHRIDAQRIRPRSGWLVRADGTQTEIRFAQVGLRKFRPVTLDGQRVYISDGESITLDRIRTDQRIILTYRNE